MSLTCNGEAPQLDTVPQLGPSPMKSSAGKTAAIAAHFVDAMDATRSTLICQRCKRSMPEYNFSILGTSLGAARSKYGYRKQVTVLHGHCRTCREQQKGKWTGHQLYTPELDRFWSDMFRLKQAGAKHRGILWALDKDDLIGKYLEQDGLCAYSGMQMNCFKTGPMTVKGTHLSAPSIDRIKSDGHYTLDNIQIVMVAVNVMKGELSDDVFLQICRQITVNKMLS